MNHWLRPSGDSRTGASHLRRGAPCQDACGVDGFRDADGTPIQVLVVSDGHGGSRYGRSDVGARLACAVAMTELRQALGTARVAPAHALGEWRRWLVEELPGRIVAAWLHAVESHWQGEPAADGSPFSPVLYGATLGVLLLTPHWWAHTGLGDWDLVRIEGWGGEALGGEELGGEAVAGEALLSEEPDGEGGGEATFSLCLPRAGRHFAARTALERLSPEAPPFALLLSSDGLRKSCGSDADFLTLCRYLAGLTPAADQVASAELAEALDHISRQGSGDDISVAVARWGPAGQGGVWPEPGMSPPARLVQPPPPAVPAPRDAAAVQTTAPAPPGSPAPFGATPAASTSAPAVRATRAATSTATTPTAASTGAAFTAAATGLPSEAGGAVTPPPEPAGGEGRDRPASAASPLATRRMGHAPHGARAAGERRPARRRRRVPARALTLVLALLGLGGLGLLSAALLGRPPVARRGEPSPIALTPGQRSDLQRQVDAFCGPGRAPGTRADAPGGSGVTPEGSDAPSQDGGATNRASEKPRAGLSPAVAEKAAGSGSAPGAPRRQGAALAQRSPRVPGGSVAALQAEGAAAGAPTSAPGSGRAASTSAAGVPATAPRPARASATTSASSTAGGSATEAGGVPQQAGTAPIPTAPIPTDPDRQRRIAATLAARASVFQRLERADPALVRAALEQSASDPLSALIAYSATDLHLRRAPVPAPPPGWLPSVGRWLAGLWRSTSRTGADADAGAELPVSPLAELAACPEFTQALRAAWQRQDARGVAGPSPVPAPSPATSAAPSPGAPAAPSPPPSPGRSPGPAAPTAAPTATAAGTVRRMDAAGTQSSRPAGASLPSAAGRPAAPGHGASSR